MLFFFEMAKLSAFKLLELDPEDSCIYSLLARFCEFLVADKSHPQSEEIY
jgi:hypothetical protein